MSTPAAAAAVRSVPVRASNFAPSSPEELRDLCDIWLDTICSAGWSTREAQRVAAFLTTCLAAKREGDLYLRDLESALNIQPEETQRALKLLKLFSVIDELQIDRGKLIVDVRFTLEQRVRLAEANGKLQHLAQAQTDRAVDAGIAALRTVATKSVTANYKFDENELQSVLGG